MHVKCLSLLGAVPLGACPHALGSGLLNCSMHGHAYAHSRWSCKDEEMLVFAKNFTTMDYAKDDARESQNFALAERA